MTAKAGDTIHMRAKTKRVAPGARQGIIEEVLDPNQPRYRVRWSDGRTTVITPLGDAVTIEPAKKPRARKKS
jgi:hypothetical protein